MIKTFVLALLFSCAAAAGDAVQEVNAAMDAFKHALIHKDGKALAKMLAEDLTYTHSAGQLETKADLIQSITSGKSIIERLDYSDSSVRVYGNTALWKGRVDLYHSPTNIVHMNVLHVWLRSGDGWKLVARQATRLAK